MRALLMLMLMAVALPAAAALYKIVGADGKVTYADKPPADVKAGKVSELKVESYNGPPQVDALGTKPDWGAILRRPVAGEKPMSAASLVLFSAEWCGPCKRAKKYMDGKGIGYTNVDIDKDAKGKVEYQRLGGRGVPLFVKGDKTMTGFSEGGLDKFLRGGS